jgi:hypothetical protein
METIFTASLGRSGTAHLVEVFNRFSTGCIAEHEPPDLLGRQLLAKSLFRPLARFDHGQRITNFGRNFQRKYVITDELLGRGKALEWYDANDLKKLRALADKRLRRITSFARKGYEHYIEVSQFFIRTHCEATIERLPNLGVIKLTRDPLMAARSLANREKTMFANSLPPDRTSNVFRIEEWSGLSRFQLYLHLWLETELRYHDFVERHEITKRFELDTTDLNDAAVLARMFATFGIEHGEIDALPPSNTNRVSTVVGAQDIVEYEALLNMAPPALIDRIGYLKNYSPPKAA